MAIVLTLAVSTIIAVLGVGLLANVDKSLPSLTGYAGSANTTAYFVFNNAFNSLSLVTVLPIVLIAAGVLAIIILALKSLALSGACE